MPTDRAYAVVEPPWSPDTNPPTEFRISLSYILFDSSGSVVLTASGGYTGEADLTVTHDIDIKEAISSAVQNVENNSSLKVETIP
jgi:hypothetical protein